MAVVKNSLAYVANDENGLQVIDVFNPALPLLCGSYFLPGNAYNVAVVGDLAYVADGGGGLWILRYAGPVRSAARDWELYQ